MQDTNEKILDLIEKHYKCVSDLFIASTLPCTSAEVRKGVVFANQEEPLSDYARLEALVRQVYVSEEAERLLNGEDRIYENADGKTAVILDHVRYLPVFCDWAHPEILSAEKDAEQKMQVRVSLPALEHRDEAAQEKYEIALEVEQENGVWKLKKCYH